MHVLSLITLKNYCKFYYFQKENLKSRLYTVFYFLTKLYHQTKQKKSIISNNFLYIFILFFLFYFIFLEEMLIWKTITTIQTEAETKI